MSKLTEKQKAFCDNLLTDPDQVAWKAYRKAYPSCTSDKTAESCASRMLSNAKVKAYLNKKRAARSKRTQVDADWLLTRLAQEADADMADLYDPVSGAIKPIHEWPKIWRQGLVSGLDVNQLTVDGQSIGEVAKIKVSDRTARLKMIGEHIGVQAFKQITEVTGKDGEAIEIKDTSDRDLARRVAFLLQKGIKDNE